MSRHHRLAVAAAICLLAAGCAVVPPAQSGGSRPVSGPPAHAASPGVAETPLPEHVASPAASGAVVSSPDPVSSSPASAPVSSSPAPYPAASRTPVPGPSGAATPRVDPGRVGTGSGPAHGSAVVLSFDDCPTSAASFRETVLAAERLGVRLVLFPTGRCVTSGKFDPAFARAHGHYVYNHSVSHPDLTKLPYDRVVAELGRPGVQGQWGRPPFGAHNALVDSAYSAVGMRIWMWDLDTHDWRGKSTDELVSYVVANALPADTILMHMQWHGFNPAALARMKSGLEARGLELCRASGPVRDRASFAC